MTLSERRHTRSDRFLIESRVAAEKGSEEGVWETVQMRGEGEDWRWMKQKKREGRCRIARAHTAENKRESFGGNRQSRKKRKEKESR